MAVRTGSSRTDRMRREGLLRKQRWEEVGEPYSALPAGVHMVAGLTPHPNDLAELVFLNSEPDSPVCIMSKSGKKALT